MPDQRLPKLAGLAEVASLAGVSRQRASQLATHPDFPEPIQRLAMGPVWLEVDVKKFLATERKPGRRPNAPQSPQRKISSTPDTRRRTEP